MQKKKFFNTRDLVLASIFIALAIVFTRVFSLRISPIQRIGFGQTPIILAGVILGPFWGFLVGSISDVTGFFMAGQEGFNPAFTLIAGLIGFFPGLFSKYIFKNKLLLATTFGVVIDLLIVNGILTTFFLAIMYGGTFVARFTTRFPVQIVMSVLQSIVCTSIIAAGEPVLLKGRKTVEPKKKAEAQ